MFDEELLQNRRKADITTCLLQPFKRHGPQLYPQGLPFFTASQELENIEWKTEQVQPPFLTELETNLPHHSGFKQNILPETVQEK